MYQKRIANLHEFIADSKAVKSSCKAKLLSKFVIASFRYSKDIIHQSIF